MILNNTRERTWLIDKGKKTSISSSSISSSNDRFARQLSMVCSVGIMGKIIQVSLLIALSLISVSQSADHSLFKTCSQSSFCRRNRGVNGTFNVDVNSLMVNPYQMNVELTNSAFSDIRFVLTVRAIEVRLNRVMQ